MDLRMLLISIKQTLNITPCLCGRIGWAFGYSYWTYMIFTSYLLINYSYPMWGQFDGWWGASITVNCIENQIWGGNVECLEPRRALSHTVTHSLRPLLPNRRILILCVNKWQVGIKKKYTYEPTTCIVTWHHGWLWLSRKSWLSSSK